MKVLFLDRDGIINMERGYYTWLPEEFEFTPHLFDFLRKMKKQGYSFIVITNQGGINKGLYSKNDVEKLHAFMLKKLAEANLEFLDVFYCPHHDDFQKCLCRKPLSLLLEKAIAMYHVNRSESLMIGDNQRDVDAAAGAGIRGLLLSSNPDWNEVNPDI